MAIKSWIQGKLTLASIVLALAGCSITENKITNFYSDNPDPVVFRMDPLEYAKALPDCDSDFNTEEEKSFEEDFPNLDLAGTEENDHHPWRGPCEDRVPVASNPLIMGLVSCANTSFKTKTAQFE